MPKVAVGANAISVGRGCVRSTSRSGLESSGGACCLRQPSNSKVLRLVCDTAAPRGKARVRPVAAGYGCCSREGSLVASAALVAERTFTEAVSMMPGVLGRDGAAEFVAAMERITCFM